MPRRIDKRLRVSEHYPWALLLSLVLPLQFEPTSPATREGRSAIRSPRLSENPTRRVQSIQLSKIKTASLESSHVLPNSQSPLSTGALRFAPSFPLVPSDSPRISRSE